MEAARATWTDSRLDDLNGQVEGMDKKMDEGFVRLDEKMDAGFARLDNKVDAGFKRLDGRIDGTNGRLDKLQHTLVQAMVALISIIAVLLIAFLGLVATHL
jgi:hypothetical protein